jgi:high-affinity nickel-transport protein
MMLSSAFTVFALGLRHGADPDHLAAIDNMTRNSAQRQPLLSRFIGTLFAGGHTVMVLAIAALVGFIGMRFREQSQAIETAGTWISIVVLLLLAALNLRQLANAQTDRVAGAKTRLLPAFLRDATSAWVAVPVGLLFGFGFETSSQIAAYAVVFGAEAGLFGALAVGSMFCVGMVCTDTLDSLLVHRLVSYRAGRLPRVMRAWIWSVTLFAIAVALDELAQLFGVRLPVSDLTVSAVLVGTLLAVFAWIFLATRSVPERVISAMEPLP